MKVNTGTSIPTEVPEKVACFHCGLDCPDRTYALGEKIFCCNGCLTVYQLLDENGLTRFYDLEQMPGVQPRRDTAADAFNYLDQDEIRKQLLDFSDGHIARVTFRVPAIHCIACVWLLENLFKLRPGIGRSQVNFPRREVNIVFEEDQLPLSQLTAFLSQLGYEPELSLDQLETTRADPTRRSLYLKTGVAGFAFANIMFMSLPVYFGLDSMSGPAFRTFFGYLSLVLALPVLFYSASDYLRAAARYFTSRVLTIDFPIALGITALFAQSAWDILSGAGEGYLDSFAGLVFFLLCGRLFQQKTYDAISFERDYRSYFPLSVTRKQGEQETTIPLSQLEVGDRLVLRNGELIPADAQLVNGEAMIDYSFVTGESDPVEKSAGDYLYAGGRQAGGLIEVETLKKVSQSYLTSLWNNEAFSKEDDEGLSSLTDRVSRYFTGTVLAVATITVLYWLFRDHTVAVRAFSSVLIVACPCALALSAPFTLGTVLRIVGRSGIFAKNGAVIERLSGIRHIVFDKTGTLTRATHREVGYAGVPLGEAERRRVYSLARHSTHPHSVRISEYLAETEFPVRVSPFYETPGKGVEGRCEDSDLLLGSKAWLAEQGIEVPEDVNPQGLTAVYLAVDGGFKGCFTLSHQYRQAARSVIASLSGRYRLSLLSGDNAREREAMEGIFGEEAELLFGQNPIDKLGYVKARQSEGARVMMIGDGLNDAGALKQSDVGIAVAENVTAFAPAADAILDAGSFGHLGGLLGYARAARAIVWSSFIISFVYNVLGIGFAAGGHLSPLVSAILMPTSSISIVVFATTAATLAGRRRGFR